MVAIFRAYGPGRALALVSSLGLLAACATSDFDPARVSAAPTDVPARFLAESAEGGVTRDGASESGCRSPMVDPRDGTRLRMIRSARDQADYSVPAGRYGVGPGELLRLDCRSGQPVGIVAR